MAAAAGVGTARVALRGGDAGGSSLVEEAVENQTKGNISDEQPEASASSTEAEGNQDDDVSMHFGDSTDSGDD